MFAVAGYILIKLILTSNEINTCPLLVDT